MLSIDPSASFQNGLGKTHGRSGIYCQPMALSDELQIMTLM
ncbi:hypothetical protein W822_18060 [Advenella kashmirensis W13003]|uniref:Uncharacterized protein n=1 Tax=Advenella kashmirensis W13003 TaxID=1424334 RepID=V8QPY3_9BURK|nr:hypothetical protein W822_18060 [Advenella kashmirensis W13003]